MASADLPSGGTSLREVVKDAPSLPDGRLLRLHAAGRGSRSESVLRWTDMAAEKAAKISRLKFDFFLRRLKNVPSLPEGRLLRSVTRLIGLDCRSAALSV